LKKGIYSKGVDYNETLAPTTKMTTIQMISALASKYNWSIHHMDVKRTFLHGEIVKKFR
jgi:hypothetical protein